jgi:phosphatidylglycerophosphatase A
MNCPTRCYSFATLWYVGDLPARGTVATFVAALLLWLLGDTYNCLFLAISITALALFSIHAVLRRFKEKDPKQIIIDEVAGFWWTLLGLPLSFGYVCAAIILFRFFDISKWFGVEYWERLPGAWGVVMDDCYAGILTNLTLRLSIFIFSYVFYAL